MKRFETLLLIFVMLILSACQPTPDAEIVVCKDVIEQSVSSMPQQEQPFSAPETWSDEFESATGSKVSVDAAVVCPHFDSLSIMSVRPKNFTQEEVDAMIKYFVGDATLYNGEYQETRSDIEQKIVETQQILAMTQEEREASIGGVTEDELKQRLRDLDARYADAPETAAKQTATSKLTKDKDGYEVLEVYAGDGGDNDVIIEVYNLVGESSNSSAFSIRLRDASAGGKILPLSGDTEQTAQAVLEGLGIKETQLRESSKAAASSDPDNRETVTRLFYERCTGGLPIRAVCRLINEDERDYAPASWQPDEISVDVGENGVAGFYWDGHSEITGVEKENVALLPFEDIMSKFEESIFLQPIWPELEKSDFESNIIISRIELCMAAVPRKNAAGEYLLVPAWNFYGYVDYTNIPESDVLRGGPNRERRECYLTLSAADGSMLHR